MGEENVQKQLFCAPFLCTPHSNLKVDNIPGKTTTLHINLNRCWSYNFILTHPSHSQDSRLLVTHNTDIHIYVFPIDLVLSVTINNSQWSNYGFRKPVKNNDENTRCVSKKPVKSTIEWWNHRMCHLGTVLRDERVRQGMRRGTGDENGWNEEVGWRTEWRGRGKTMVRCWMSTLIVEDLAKIKPTEPLPIN